MPRKSSVLFHLLSVISFILLDSVFASTGGTLHFHNCKLCECFTKFEDRDIWNQEPAGMVQMAYDVSEDECLNVCLTDINECSAVVYGLVGGRSVFTCELYAIGGPKILPDGPQYTNGLNVYIPKKNQPCKVKRDGIKLLDAGPTNDLIAKRKAYFMKLYSMKNPFNWGRKK